jgi:ribosomal-protein-alanine N-acetyltransferase
MNDFVVRVFRSGEESGTSWTAESLSKQLADLANTSSYAPSSESLKQFVAQVLGAHQQSGEQNILVLLTDGNNVAHGFAQVRYFGDTADLDFIILHESARGYGYAVGMLCRTFEILKENSVNKLLLEVGRQNSAALSLYTRLGFCQIAVRKGYYKTGEDALVLEKSI